MTRRRALGALAGLGALSLTHRASASQGQRMLIVGDSMIATAFGEYLEAGLVDRHEYAVTRRGKSSSGLARPDFFDWMAQAQQLEAQHRPESVVVMMGGNDAQGLFLGRRQWETWGTPTWRKLYAERVRQFADLLTRRERPLFWVGLPIVRSSSYRRKVALINDIVRDEMTSRPHGNFISTWHRLATRDGRYTDTISVRGKPTLVREADGVHLTMAGAHVLEAYVRPIVHGKLASTYT